MRLSAVRCSEEIHGRRTHASRWPPAGLKTLDNPKNKKASVATLLAKTLPKPELRERVERELKELTEIGNGFMIRHTEVGKTPIEDAHQIDYLFHRMFSSIRLLLKATGRGV